MRVESGVGVSRHSRYKGCCERKYESLLQSDLTKDRKSGLIR